MPSTRTHFENQLLSCPMQVEFVGFRSDTYRLQQAGWEFLVDEDVINQALHIVMRHRDTHTVGVMLDQRFDYYRALDQRRYMHEYVLRPSVVARDVRIAHHAGHLPFNFKTVDMVPSYRTTEVTSMHDLTMFNVPMVKTKEIYVPKGTVDELLTELLSMHDESEQRYYEEKIRNQNPEGCIPEANPQLIQHAQLVSVA